ncbi:helix-turn-helix domain-containing protein [Enterococcus durans]|uniref:helix-turn-helix domain-containing protein n=2 Tax=Enterococcus durans TaxID=53345 RepID=UPI001E5D6DF5|nr:helix-turn-helix domain-containing protein [Enterococcus durans]MDU1850302.1 helix-turn-helix domain-containing protein [Enterococcus durans]
MDLIRRIKQKRINVRRLLGILGSYLVAFLLPFLSVSWIWYITATESTEQQVRLMAKNQMMQINYSLESNFLKLAHLTERITDNRQLALSSLDHPYYIKEGKSILHTYKITSELVEEVYLYYRNDRPEMLYSSSGNYSLELFLRKTVKNDHQPEKRLQEQLATTDAKFITIASDEELPSSSYLYVVPIQNKEGTVHSIAIYEIKKNTLTKVLDAYSPASTNLNYIIDESYQLVTKTKSEELNTFLSTPYSVEKLMTKENVKIKQKRYLIQSLKNPYLNLSLLSLVDPTTALLTIERVQTKMIVLILVILFMGLVIVVLFSMRNLRPIQKIEYLAQQFQEDPTLTVSSLKEVSDTLAKFLIAHQKLTIQNQLQIPYAREQVFQRLLNSQLVIDSELEQLLTAVHIKFSTEYYFIATIDLKQLDQSKERINNQWSEAITKNYCAYGVENIENQTFVFAIGCGSLDEQAELVQMITERCSQPIRIGVGSIVHSLGQLNRSYIESRAALRYPNVKGTIRYYSELTTKENALSIEYPSDLRLKLVNYLENGEFDHVLETIRELISYGELNLKSENLQKLYGYYLLNTILQIGNELIGKGIFHHLEELPDFSSLIELENFLNELAERICKKMGEIPKKQPECLEEQILAYLQQNFQSAQLSLESTATAFSVSVSFVSRSIRKESGLTFSKYIQMLRFRKIKQELAETELPIKVIIQQNGYYDISNFTRKFRQIVGMTPGKYREMNRK